MWTTHDCNQKGPQMAFSRKLHFYSSFWPITCLEQEFQLVNILSSQRARTSLEVHCPCATERRPSAHCQLLRRQRGLTDKGSLSSGQQGQDRRSWVMYSPWYKLNGFKDLSNQSRNINILIQYVLKYKLIQNIHDKHYNKNFLNKDRISITDSSFFL